MHNPGLSAEDFEIPFHFQQDLMRIGSLRYRPAGAILVSEGQQCNSTYFITDGNLRMSHVIDSYLEDFELTLGPGSLVCLFAAMSKTRSPVRVEAAVPSHLMLAEAGAIRELMKKRAGFSFEIARILSHEVHAFLCFGGITSNIGQ
jgi:CRP-like cAMP-binding protein